MAPRKDQPRNDRQEKILEYIKSEVQRRGFPPSVREICDAMGIKSTSTVHGHLRRLENRGLLIRDPTKPRALEVVGMVHNTAQIPLVGKATAGLPITAIENIENIEEYLSFTPGFFCSDEEDCFALHVTGDSMINAGIYDGDVVIVHQQQTAENGDIIVALINDEDTTIKRFYKEECRVRLQPENDQYSPMYFNNVSILGKVIGSLRRF